MEEMSAVAVLNGESRTGAVTVELTLAPDGAVQQSKLIENTVHTDPALVWRCIQKQIPSWKLRAPEGVSPAVRVTVRLADRC